MSRFASFASFVLVVAVLRIAAEVLIPLALAALLAFLLSPMVVWFTRRGAPKLVAIVATVTVFFAVIGALGWVVATQAVNLAERLPDYEQNIRSKIEKVRNPQAPEKLSRTTEMLENLQADLQAADPEEKTKPDNGEPKPMPVEVHEPERSPLALARGLAGPVLGPLAMGGIVIVLVVAMLIQRDDLRDRFIKIVSAGRLNLATQALDDAARRVTRYLLMQLVVNATYGIPVGIALAVIGVPNAVLWAVLATLLRFIPFLGPWVAASFPVALAIAVDPGWTMVLWTLAVFIFMEVVSNNVIEVKLYGVSTGISNLALLVAAVFWTWLWGPVGLFLSTPLTVCLLVLGRHVPGLKLLSMLLGSSPVLEPPAQFYQRMLSMDADEMGDLARKFIADRSLVAFYDDVFVPALRMAEHDREQGTLAEVRQKFIFRSGRELIEDLARDDAERDDTETDSGNSPADRPAMVLGIPARDDADELVALMLAHVLRTNGMETRVVPLAESTHVERPKSDRSDTLVVVSALPPSAVTAARQTFRRLRRQMPGTRIVLGVWDRTASPADLTRRLGVSAAGDVVTTFAEALVALTDTNDTHAGPVTAPASATHHPGDSRALEEWFQHATREIARAFDVPVSLVSLVDSDLSFWIKQAAALPELAKASEAARDEALCGALLAEEDVLVIEDVAKDRRLTANTVLSEGGVRFYAGAALRLPGGHPVGVLCVTDTKPRSAPPEALQHLRKVAAELVGRIQPRPDDA